MAFALQMLRALIDAHPDRAALLKLFEAVHETIAPQLGIDLSDVIEFPTRNSRIIKAMDFSVPNHPDADKINAAISKLLGSINGTASALAELSNIPNLRHGGSLDWGTLQRQHAIMLGGLCDTLASFLFDVAWSRAPAQAAATEPDRYEDFGAFNTSLDDEHETVEIAGSTFLPSRILHALDPIQYEAARVDWEAERAVLPGDEGAAA
jgi:hypothetical protein